MEGFRPENLLPLARALTQAGAPAAGAEPEVRGWDPQTWSSLCREGLGKPD